jgi:uncharacterized protein (TIGR03435 family)
MKRIIAAAGLLALLADGLFGQTAEARPEFDVADIRQNKSGDSGWEGGVLPGGQFGVRNATLKLLLGWAYSDIDRFIDTYVAGAPAWAGKDRFDITGKTPAGTSDQTIALMLQVFLEHEFKLKTHQEQRSMDAFALVVRKGGPKLANAAGSGDPDCEDYDPKGPNYYGGVHQLCTNMSMADLAQKLPELARNYIDRPVVDLTGLTGVYDFKLDWVGRRSIDNGGLTIFDAITKLGLKLAQRKLPVTVTVVDHIEKLSDDN